MAVQRKQLSQESKKPAYPCKWKEKTFTALEILQKQELPIVVMIKNSTADVEPNFDTSQPVLLFSSTVKTKVVAHSLVPNRKSVKFTEGRDRVVIPVDYAGKTTNCEHRSMASILQMCY